MNQPAFGEVTSHRVARNGALYFFSLGVPAAAALVFVPITVRSLGPARFGLLALAWAVAESTGIFDFGLGKATVRFVADATAKGRERLKEIILASLFTQTAMGALAGLILFTFARPFVNHVITVAPNNVTEATSMFRVLALHMPVLLAVAALRASLDGAQRFDIGTPLRVPWSLASVIVPALAASGGYSLGAIMWMLLAVRVILTLLTAYAIKRVHLIDHWSLPSGFATLREMLGYSGWVAVSAVLGPVLSSFDRFAVGAVIGGSLLGYYSGAAEAANRFLLIPVTAFTAMLPALAATDAHHGRERSLTLVRGARRQLAALLLPLCLALFVFGPQLLGVWLGNAYVTAAGPSLRILSVGVFLTGLAILPLALLYGSGRPDLPAKINIAQAAAHIPLTLILVHTIGISGAALAVTILRAEDLIFYQWAVRRTLGRPIDAPHALGREAALWWSGIALAVSFVLAYYLKDSWLIASIALVVAGTAAYIWACWTRVFSREERNAWMGIVFRGGSARGLAR